MYREKCKTLENTKKLAYKFANLVKDEGCFVNLFGEIGAGKTAFVKLVAEALGIKEKVTSPSFVILNEYHSASIPVYHFDLYRLEYPEQLYDIGYEEYLYSDGISIIEWPSNMDYLYPEKYILIKIECIDDTTREITVSTNCSAMLKNATI